MGHQMFLNLVKINITITLISVRDSDCITWPWFTVADILIIWDDICCCLYCSSYQCHGGHCINNNDFTSVVMELCLPLDTTWGISIQFTASFNLVLMIHFHNPLSSFFTSPESALPIPTTWPTYLNMSSLQLQFHGSSPNIIMVTKWKKDTTDGTRSMHGTDEKCVQYESRETWRKVTSRKTKA
jgi:hypothetical protein